MKKKFLVSSFLFFITIISLSAQVNSRTYDKIKYQGDVLVGGNIVLNGSSNSFVGSFSAEIVNGVRFNDYVSIGIGTGITYSKENFLYNPQHPLFSIPLYLNTKGYILVSKKNHLFISCDLGGFWGLYNKSDGNGASDGILVKPSIGFTVYEREDGKAISLMVGYEYNGAFETFEGSTGKYIIPHHSISFGITYTFN